MSDSALMVLPGLEIRAKPHPMPPVLGFFRYTGSSLTSPHILDGNNEYVKANLVESTFLGLDLNLLLMLDTSGQIVYGRGFDLDKAEHKPLPEGIVQHVQPDSILLDHEDED